ncbi:hypothetical protein [Pararhodobacter marinus]|uniref:hypothetical protein n=1 Tax=Pararhodobacter marinus TaxID=2184063 RepID=UPI0035150101
MTRLPLALAALLTLSLNGSLAAAMEGEMDPVETAPCRDDAVCALPLRMLTPPPQRPEGLALRASAVTAETGRD